MTAAVGDPGGVSDVVDDWGGGTAPPPPLTQMEEETVAAVHPALEFQPFNHLQAQIDYNRALLRRSRIVAWDCSTMTLQAIRDRLVHQQVYAACRLSIGGGNS